MIFSYPLAFDSPVRGFPSEYWHPVWYGKLEWWGYPMVENLYGYLKRLRLNTGVLQTDGQTDRQTQTSCQGTVRVMYTRRAVKTYLSPRRGWPRQNFVKMFDADKTRNFLTSWSSIEEDSKRYHQNFLFVTTMKLPHALQIYSTVFCEEVYAVAFFKVVQQQTIGFVENCG